MPGAKSQNLRTSKNPTCWQSYDQQAADRRGNKSSCETYSGGEIPCFGITLTSISAYVFVILIWRRRYLRTNRLGTIASHGIGTIA